MAPRPPDPCSHPYSLPPEAFPKGLPYGKRAPRSLSPVEPCPLGVRQVRRLSCAAAAWEGVRCRAEICPHRWRAGPCSVWVEIPGGRLPGGLVCLVAASSRLWLPQEHEAGWKWSRCGRHPAGRGLERRGSGQPAWIIHDIPHIHLPEQVRAYRCGAKPCGFIALWRSIGTE